MRTSNNQIRKNRYIDALVRWGSMVTLTSVLLCLSAFAQTPRIAESTAQNQGETDAKAFAAEKEKLSYAYGATTGNYFRRLGVEIDPELFMQGVNDALAGGETRLTMDEARAIVDAAQKALKAKQQAALKAEQSHAAKVLAEKNLIDGESFMAENKNAEGVVTLASGLQYKVLKAGDGRKPKLGDSVVCHYRGTLIDGTEFDSSYKRKNPATFAIDRVIKGWTEALQLMPTGSKWQLFVPARLAYGERGAGRNIGPNAALIFEVELISITEGSPQDGQSANPKDQQKLNVEADGQETDPGSSNGGLTTLKVSYKLDPRVTSGTYSGERWVSPARFTRVLEPKGSGIDIRVRGLNAQGTPVQINPQWTPGDPSIVTISVGQSGDVKLSVHRAGETSVRITSDGVSTELAIKATPQDDGLRVDIRQAESKRVLSSKFSEF